MPAACKRWVKQKRPALNKCNILLILLSILVTLIQLCQTNEEPSTEEADVDLGFVDEGDGNTEIEQSKDQWN